MSSRADVPPVIPMDYDAQAGAQAALASGRLTVSRICGGLLVCGGVLVLLGWVLGLPRLTALSPDWANMKVNTAVAFVLCGLALWTLYDKRGEAGARRFGVAAAMLAFSIAALSLAEDVFTVNMGIDELLLQQPTNSADRAQPGRMATATAVCFMLLAAAMLLQATRLRRRASMSLLLAWIVCGISLFAVIGYAYGVTRTLYPVWPFSTMALHTALLFTVGAVGILGARAAQSPLAILASEGRGGVLARRILPLAVIAPVAIGWLTLRGAEAGLYELRFGVTALVSGSIAAFTAMIWVAATALNRGDALQGQAISAVAREASRRRALFENARDGIFVFDADRNIFEANLSFANLLGYTVDEVLNLHPWDWDVNYDTRESFLNAWPELPATSGQLQTQFRRKGGDIIDAEISYSPAELDGKPYLYCVCKDVSARKRAERALHDSEERFRRALANIPDVVVIYDRDLRARYVNHSTHNVTGMSADELIGCRDDEVYPSETCDAWLPALQEACESKSATRINTEIALSGDRRRSVCMTFVPLLDRRGDLREVLGITHDYTEQQQARRETRATQTQYRELIEQAADGIFIADADGHFVLVNSRCCSLLGYSRDELLAMTCQDAGLDEEVEFQTGRQAQLLAGNEVRYERLMKRKDGSQFPAEISIKMLGADRRQVIFHDITARYQQERKIARLSRIHAVLSGINSAIVRIRDRMSLFREVCRIAVDAGQFQCVWIGKLQPDTGRMMMLAQSGLPLELPETDDETGPLVDLMPDGPAQFCMQEQRPVYDNDIERSMHLTKTRRMAIRQRSKSVIALPVSVESKLFGIVVLYAPERNFFDDEELKLLKELAGDISFALEFMAKEEKVDYLAYYDTLTGLPNRRLFFDALKRQLSLADHEDRRVVLQLFDIDRFRMINETYGRDEADRLIIDIAGRITAATGDQDTVARVGPDSFAVAISGDWQAAGTAHELEALNARVFGKPYRVQDEELRISATSGVVMYPGDGAEPHALLTNAEAAQRSAEKQNIRFEFYSPDMNERVAESMRLENRLRQALEQDEILMWYQPKLDLKGGRLTGFEALMRWQDRTSGRLESPAEFIPIMEQTGLILDAGRRALSKVVSDCSSWATAETVVPRIAVNVSAIQLQEEGFLPSMVEAQEKAEAAGCKLELELTESVVMHNVESIVSKLEMLRNLGVLISVDDFGTGYSSLAYIARLPIHSLKIDRSFVFEMTRDDSSLAIVKSTITLAHSLGLKVVAEGVETDVQRDMLAALDCDEIQGYFVSPPIAPEAVPEFLAKLRG